MDDKKHVISYGIIFVDDAEVIHNLTTKINQNIVFVDLNTWKVYENYAINDIMIKKQLGFFNNSLHYIPITKKSFEDRRANFHGYKMKTMTEHYPPFISLELSTAKYDDSSQTYDVTHSTRGMMYDIFMDLQESLNITSSLHKRKDGKWGPTTGLAIWSGNNVSSCMKIYDS